MKNQSRNHHKLALRRETVRLLDQLALAGVAGGSIVPPPTLQCPTRRICLTTTTNTTA
ncbi:MAG TPA: hypothetical protein VIX73_27635 [Kofleriaceae bacterium]|jgi:hypothetical protein